MIEHNYHYHYSKQKEAEEKGEEEEERQKKKCSDAIMVLFHSITTCRQISWWRRLIWRRIHLELAGVLKISSLSD